MVDDGTERNAVTVATPLNMHTTHLQAHLRGQTDGLGLSQTVH
jgi:hypothetical protein